MVSGTWQSVSVSLFRYDSWTNGDDCSVVTVVCPHDILWYLELFDCPAGCCWSYCLDAWAVCGCADGTRMPGSRLMQGYIECPGPFVIIDNSSSSSTSRRSSNGNNNRNGNDYPFGFPPFKVFAYFSPTSVSILLRPGRHLKIEQSKVFLRQHHSYSTCRLSRACFRPTIFHRLVVGQSRNRHTPTQITSMNTLCTSTLVPRIPNTISAR